MSTLSNGFYTALGTPVDDNGCIVVKSLEKHIQSQINANAAGLLLMGSMGMEPAIRDKEYATAVSTAAKATNGKLPLFVGAMDNSIARVLDRIDTIKGQKIDGIVITSPFYFTSPADELINFFIKIADKSPYPIYLYDLPVATKHKITFPMVEKLSKHPNICGIKSGDFVLINKIKNNIPNFNALYSNIDCFDAAYNFGVTKVLDGMFSCTPRNAYLMSKAFETGDIKTASEHLSKILSLRDLMASLHLFPCFTTLMNILGFEGKFHPDYLTIDGEDFTEQMKNKLIEIGEM